MKNNLSCTPRSALEFSNRSLEFIWNLAPGIWNFFPIALAIALLANAPLHAAVDRSKKPVPEPAPAAAFPDYKTFTLRNGLKVFVIEDDRKPTLSLRLLIKGGASTDGSGIGLSDFVAA